jgi:hypothetical protein
LGDLSLKPSPLFSGDLEVVEWVVSKDIADEAGNLLPRFKPALRDELVADWDRRHKLRRHADCAALPKSVKRNLSQCFRAGTCLCQQQTLVRAHGAFLSVVKKILRAKSGPRTLADHSMLVFKFESAAFKEPVWQHLSFANFQTWRLRSYQKQHKCLGPSTVARKSEGNFLALCVCQLTNSRAMHDVSVVRKFKL